MANRLATETSPYLRQHAENPVDWYPWGPDALERARREGRPILLSIGYSACHWCHVMAHESFEDEATARLMNELFVNVKVDREERPDIDAIYMQAVQAMTGHGGWPLTVFLTPEGEPFYGGTYFPPEDRPGMPSFRRVLAAVGEAWRTRQDGVQRTVEAMRELYRGQGTLGATPGELGARTLQQAAERLVSQFDARHGGFDGAPKFPPSMALDFLLRHWRRTGDPDALAVVRRTVRAMARGGIYDQIGGGLHRYAVDAAWQVPHFEKMLYDNALLVRLCVHLWQATGDLEARRVAEETLEWLAREMTSRDGGFFSALDADSEGEEGKFYLWDAAEVDALLGDDAPLARAYFGVTAAGNFEGRNILHVAADPDVVAERAGVDVERLAEVVARAKSVLYAARARRVWPGRDEKIIAGWNGLMLRAVALAAATFEHDEWRALALRNGALLRRELVRDGRVLRLRPAPGARAIPGFLEDHAAVALGFLSLYELTFDRAWLDDARRLAQAVVEWFWDDETGVFHDTARDAERLITRPRDITDNAVPAGSSLAAELLLHLGDLLDDTELRRRGARVVSALAGPMAQHPIAFGHLLGVADLVVHGAVEVALVGDPADGDGLRALHAAVRRRYVPSLVLAGGPPGAGDDVALLAGRPARDGRATAYVCRHYACEQPVTDPEALLDQLERAPAVR